MSGSAPGSLYGRGPFGAGRYSRLASKNASVALRSASRLTAAATVTIAATVALRSTSRLAAGAHVMWSAIDVPPCQPWTLIAACGCPGIPAWPV